jgi:two-component system nitrogen regulation response regulator GlnG
MSRLLIVDDEANVLYSFRKALQSEQLEVVTSETATEGIEAVEQQRPDAVILDVRLPDLSGLDAFEQIRQIDPHLPVIIVTAHSTTETAINATKRGAFDYLLKPVDIHQLRDLVAKAIELSRLRHVPAIFDDASDDDLPGDRIVGRSPAMQQVYKAIGRVASEDVTVLIRGESGTGKELVARALYHHSDRHQQPFLAINCAALPETLLESELFGHERAAFTGADRRRIGKFEQADGGTLFLDELGDMSPATQAKVLRVLQDGRFERVGGDQTIETDVRVVAATNQDLDAAITSGHFRQDLLYRLNGFTIQLPPLRERHEDLPLLVEHFLKLANQEVNQPATTLAPETMRLIQRYPWPGNIRELQSAIKYAVVHAIGDVVTPDCLPDGCRRSAVAGTTDRAEEAFTGVAEYVRGLLDDDSSNLYRCVLDKLDRVVLREVLRHLDGNQVRAAERLGMSRTTLRAKLRSVGLDQTLFRRSD